MLAGDSVTTTITYTLRLPQGRLYDPLPYRLTNADYSDGISFAYTYNSVGNRLTEQINNTGG